MQAKEVESCAGEKRVNNWQTEKIIIGTLLRGFQQCDNIERGRSVGRWLCQGERGFGRLRVLVVDFDVLLHVGGAGKRAGAVRTGKLLAEVHQVVVGVVHDHLAAEAALAGAGRQLYEDRVVVAVAHGAA